MDAFITKLLAEFTVKQLWAFGVGSVVVVLLGAGLWLSWRYFLTERTREQELTRYWADKYVDLVNNVHASQLPMSDAIKDVSGAVQENTTLIRENTAVLRVMAANGSGAKSA